MYITLYAKALNGKVKTWYAEEFNDCILIRSGYFGGNLSNYTSPKTMKSDEILSLIKKKKREGYKDMNDIFALTNEKEPAILSEEWLQKVLPISNLDANYNLKPMKCQKFQKGKFKYPAIIQAKINGVRAVMKLEKAIVGKDLFAKEIDKVVIRSKSGLEYHLPHITDNIDKSIFVDKATGIELVFDGELYVHGLPLNVINSACPLINDNGTIARSKYPSVTPQLRFFTFDLSIDDIKQSDRIDILEMALKKNDEKYIIVVQSWMVDSDDNALTYAKNAIQMGYEGSVLRTLDTEYKFGGRPMTMMKLKMFQDAEFEVLDIIPKPKEPETALFVCKNDINDEVFECNPMGTYEMRKEYLENKVIYIGKFATVKFYERSGVKQVPFHANVTTIRDYE